MQVKTRKRLMQCHERNSPFHTAKEHKCIQLFHDIFYFLLPHVRVICTNKQPSHHYRDCSPGGNIFLLKTKEVFGVIIFWCCYMHGRNESLWCCTVWDVWESDKGVVATWALANSKYRLILKKQFSMYVAPSARIALYRETLKNSCQESFADTESTWEKHMLSISMHLADNRKRNLAYATVWEN